MMDFCDATEPHSLFLGWILKPRVVWVSVPGFEVEISSHDT
jgi:hypothetical protein